MKGRGERGEAREGGREGWRRCPVFQRQFSLTTPKERGEEEEGSKKRETRRKARARGVGGGGGRV